MINEVALAENLLNGIGINKKCMYSHIYTLAKYYLSQGNDEAETRKLIFTWAGQQKIWIADEYNVNQIIYKARHEEQEPDNNPLFAFANSFREWIIFSEIYQSLGIDVNDTDTRYKYYQLCMNEELYNAIYLNINSMQILDFLVKYEYQVYCSAVSDSISMQIEPMLFMLLRFHDSICAWKNFMNARTAYQPEVKNFDDTLDFLIKNCKSSYLGYLAERYL